MSFQPTNQVMMVRPIHFRYNKETAIDNAFQVDSIESDSETQSKAEKEFDGLVKALEEAGVKVLVISDDSGKDTPDSIFPNNWISTHSNGQILLYPMFAENRRDEVRDDILKQLTDEFGYRQVINLTNYVEKNQFLEGTGSLVLDRENHTAYCCLSERTSLELAEKWAFEMGYDLVYFNAVDEDGKAIYHTNVMLTLAKDYVVICLDTIRDIAQREMVIEAIERSEKELIEISLDQMNQFAGNMLELADENGNSLVLMSQSAYNSLDQEQIDRISSFSKIVRADIPTIEKNGGGSVRCMVAEIFQPA